MTDGAPTARAPYLFPRLEERLLLLKHLAEFSPLPILITAPAGGGKTTFCEHLVTGAAEPHWQTVALRGHPGLTRDVVLSALEHGLDLAAAGADAAMDPGRMTALEQRVEYLIHTRELPLVVADDADEMPVDALRCLAELSRAAGLRLVLAGSREISLPEVDAAPADGGFPHRIELPPLGPADLDGFEAHLAERSGRNGLPVDGAEAAALMQSSQGNPGQLATLLRQRSHGTPRTGQLARLWRAPRLGRIGLPLAMIGALVTVAVGVNLLLPSRPGPEGRALAPPTRLPAPNSNGARGGSTGAERPDGIPTKDDARGASMPRGPEAEKTQVQAQAPIHASGGAAPPVRAQGSPTSEAAIEPDLPPSAPDAGQADTQATAGDRGVSGTTPRQTAVAPEQADTGADSGTDSDGDSEAGNAASARTGIDPPASAVNAGSVPDAGAPPAAAGSTAPPASEASDSPPERSASSPKSDAEPIPALTSTPPESAPSATGLGAFAVQVIGSRDKSAVYEFIEGLNIGLPRFVARTMHQGEPWYIGVVGAFDERDAALASLSKLPESLKKRRPWVKDMRGLEADRIDPITP